MRRLDRHELHTKRRQARKMVAPVDPERSEGVNPGLAVQQGDQPRRGGRILSYCGTSWTASSSFAPSGAGSFSSPPPPGSRSAALRVYPGLSSAAPDGALSGLDRLLAAMILSTAAAVLA